MNEIKQGLFLNLINLKKSHISLTVFWNEFNINHMKDFPYIYQDADNNIISGNNIWLYSKLN